MFFESEFVKIISRFKILRSGASTDRMEKLVHNYKDYRGWGTSQIIGVTV